MIDYVVQVGVCALCLSAGYFLGLWDQGRVR